MPPGAGRRRGFVFFTGRGRISHHQRRRFATAPETPLVSISADRPVCQSTPLILQAWANPASSSKDSRRRERQQGARPLHTRFDDFSRRTMHVLGRDRRFCRVLCASSPSTAQISLPRGYVAWTERTASGRTSSNRVATDRQLHRYVHRSPRSSASSAFASFRSVVSKPSVNEP